MKMMLKNFYNFSGACVCAGNSNMACGSNADRCEGLVLLNVTCKQDIYWHFRIFPIIVEVVCVAVLKLVLDLAIHVLGIVFLSLPHKISVTWTEFALLNFYLYSHSGSCHCGSNAACAQDTKGILGDTCSG